MTSVLEYIEDLDIEVLLSGEVTKGEYGEDGGEAWGAKYLSTIQEYDKVEEITFDRSLYDYTTCDTIEQYISANYERLEKDLIFEFNR